MAENITNREGKNPGLYPHVSCYFLKRRNQFDDFFSFLPSIRCRNNRIRSGGKKGGRGREGEGREGSRGKLSLLLPVLSVFLTQASTYYYYFFNETSEALGEGWKEVKDKALELTLQNVFWHEI